LGRRSLGRALPAAGRTHTLRGDLWVAPDEQGSRLRRCRIHGPAALRLSTPLRVRRRRFSRGRLVARCARRRLRRGEAVVDALELSMGERLEVRP